MRTTYIKYFSLVMVTLLVINSTVVHGQEKVWQWTASMGSASWDYINGIKSDSEGNIYIGGAYTADFSIKNKDVKSLGKQDMFVAKYNQKGKLQWVWNAGGKQSDKLTALHVNNNDELLISGIVSGEMKIEKHEFGGETKKLILAKLTNKGKLVWIKSFPIEGVASIIYLYESDSCGIIAAGTFKKTLSIEGQKEESAGKEDIFIARFTLDGNLKNLKTYGGNGKDVITAFAGSENGKLYLSGTYEGDISFDNKILENQGQNVTGAFIAALDQNLDMVWIQAPKSQYYVDISAIAPAQNNELFISGNFTHKIQVGDREVISKGGIDFYASKLNSNGEPVWIKSFGTPYSDYANNIALNPAGGIMLNGTFNDTLLLDTIQLVTIEGNAAAFVSQINNNGNVFWAKSIGGKSNVSSHHSTLDTQGNIYLSGSFTNTVDNPEFKISSKGNEDIYIAKYFNCPDYHQVIQGDTYLCPGEEAELKIKGDFDNISWNNGLSTDKKITITVPGKYFVQMTDNYACLVTDTIEVKEAKNPVFYLGNDTVLFTDQSIRINGPQGSENYLWFNNNTMPMQEISAQGNSYHKIDVWLQVTDKLNCQFTDSMEVSFEPKSPMIDIDQILELKIHPNPVSDIFYWSLNCDTEVSLYVELTNTEGQHVFMKKIYNYEPQQEFPIYVGNLPVGIYYLNIGNGKEKISKMVIKK